MAECVGQSRIAASTAMSDCSTDPDGRDHVTAHIVECDENTHPKRKASESNRQARLVSTSDNQSKTPQRVFVQRDHVPATDAAEVPGDVKNRVKLTRNAAQQLTEGVYGDTDPRNDVAATTSSTTTTDTARATSDWTCAKEPRRVARVVDATHDWIKQTSIVKMAIKRGERVAERFPLVAPVYAKVNEVAQKTEVRVVAVLDDLLGVLDAKFKEISDRLPSVVEKMQLNRLRRGIVSYLGLLGGSLVHTVFDSRQRVMDTISVAMEMKISDVLQTVFNAIRWMHSTSIRLCLRVVEVPKSLLVGAYGSLLGQGTIWQRTPFIGTVILKQMTLTLWSAGWALENWIVSKLKQSPVFTNVKYVMTEYSTCQAQRLATVCLDVGEKTAIVARSRLGNDRYEHLKTLILDNCWPAKVLAESVTAAAVNFKSQKAGDITPSKTEKRE